MGGAKSVMPDEKFATNLCESLTTYQKRADFTDVKIFSKVQKCFYAHKVVLSISYPKLRPKLLTRNGLFMNVSNEAVQGILDYAYTGKLLLNEHTLDLMTAAMEFISHGDLARLLTDELKEHLCSIVNDKTALVKLNVAEMSVLVFAAKLLGKDITSNLFNWHQQQSASDNNLNSYLAFMDYLVNAKPGDDFKLLHTVML